MPDDDDMLDDMLDDVDDNDHDGDDLNVARIYVCEYCHRNCRCAQITGDERENNWNKMFTVSRRGLRLHFCFLKVRSPYRNT